MQPEAHDDIWLGSLLRALRHVGLEPGARAADVGAGVTGATAVLAEHVGAGGIVYAIDHDPDVVEQIRQAPGPATRTAEASSAGRIVAVMADARRFFLPEPVDLAYCRFLLLHVSEPAQVIEQMARCARGWVVAQEPVTSGGRVGGRPLSMPGARSPDIGATLPSLVRGAGLELIDAWCESPAGAGPGRIARYLEELTGVEPGDESILLPPLVTVVARTPASVP